MRALGSREHRRVAAAALSLTVMTAAFFLWGSWNSSRAAPVETRYLIGVSQANLSEPWRIAMTEEIRREAAKQPDMRVILADAVDSSDRQVGDVERLLTYGIDLLIISPTDSRALTPAVTEAYRKIPVIVLDRDVEGYDYTLYIGPDNRLIGREAGRYVSELLGNGGGTVWEVQGRADSPPTLDRSEGFRQEIGLSPSIRLVDTVTADWLRDLAEDTLGSHLQRNRAPDVIVAQNDAMAYGAALALKKSGLTGTRIIGVDGLEGPNGGLDLVKRGILSATFICPTGGKESVAYARDILERRPGIPKKIYLRSVKVAAGMLGDVGLAPGLGKDAAETPGESRSANGGMESPTAIDASLPERALANSRTHLPADRPIRLGFAQVGSESRWRLANTRSIVDAARRAGIDLLFEDGRQKQEVQIAAIRSFIQKKVDVIAFSPIVESGWEEVLREAKEAGIPVILSDREVDLKDDSLWATFLGSDFTEEGRRAARWLVSNMRDKKTPDGTIRIVELRGTEGSAPAIDRKRGFEETLAPYPSFRIVRSEVADFYLDRGRDAMRKILASSVGRIDVLFAHNDDMALGAIQAIEEAGLKPGKDIVIVSVDAVKEAFKAMIAGKLNCTVECTPLLGPQLMKVVQDYFAGKSLPTRIITSEEVFPAESAVAALPKRRY